MKDYILCKYIGDDINNEPIFENYSLINFTYLIDNEVLNFMGYIKYNVEKMKNEVILLLNEISNNDYDINIDNIKNIKVFSKINRNKDI